MKRVKMLGLLAVAATALMAFAGTASASTFTSPEGTTYTGEVVATSTNFEHVMAFITTSCKHLEYRFIVEQHGAVNAGGKVSTLTFKECNFPTTVKSKGTLEITSSGAVISKGMEVSMETNYGTCVYTTAVFAGTTIGVFTEGANASHDFNSTKMPRTGGNFLCGSTATWRGSFDLISPNALWVD